MTTTSMCAYMNKNNHFFLPDKPCIPEGPIVVDALLKSSIVISWKAPKDDGGSMITNYIVEKREAKEGEQWQLVSSSVSGTTCRVPNLIESAGYYFRVSAKNQYGVSESLEIPSVVIVKSPFGESKHTLSAIFGFCGNISEHNSDVPCLFPRKTWHSTTALHHQRRQGLLCGLLEAPKQRRRS